MTAVSSLPVGLINPWIDVSQCLLQNLLGLQSQQNNINGNIRTEKKQFQHTKADLINLILAKESLATELQWNPAKNFRENLFLIQNKYFMTLEGFHDHRVFSYAH